MIYQIALVSRYGHHTYNATSRRGTPLPRPLDVGSQTFEDRHWMCPALLATSQMIYYEARTLYWAQPFEFTNTANFYRFLQDIGPRARILLRDVTIKWIVRPGQGVVPGDEDVMRLLEEAKQMRLFRVVVSTMREVVSAPLRSNYQHQLDTWYAAVQSFRTALGESHFASSRVHGSSEVCTPMTFPEGLVDRVITTETWKLNP